MGFINSRTNNQIAWNLGRHYSFYFVFILSILKKNEAAHEITDLFDASLLEDRFWTALKYITILVERQ